MPEAGVLAADDNSPDRRRELAGKLAVADSGIQMLNRAQAALHAIQAAGADASRAGALRQTHPRSLKLAGSVFARVDCPQIGIAR
jgi:hypothetical protein